MTLLDDIIDGSTNSSIAVSDLLRKVQVVATRVGATDVVSWVKQELQGYDNAEDLPAYRVQRTNVTGLFTGPMRSQIRADIPSSQKFDEYFIVQMQGPIREIEEFANGEHDAQREWAAPVVQQYEQSGIFQIEFHGLFSAWNTITRQSLHGIIDTVRSKAMEFALELQEQYPDAGSAGGPTIASEQGLAQVVWNITNNITGDGTNVASGNDIHQRSTVRKGDVESLRAQAQSLGLSSADAEEFAAAVNEEQSTEGTRVQAMLSRVKAGSLELTTRVSTSLVAAALLDAGKQFLGLS